MFKQILDVINKKKVILANSNIRLTLKAINYLPSTKKAAFMKTKILKLQMKLKCLKYHSICYRLVKHYIYKNCQGQQKSLFVYLTHNTLVHKV